MYEFKLPDLGEGIHEGEILKWHIAEGDSIKEDAPLVDIETDKAAVTIPSPKSGKIVSLKGKVGDIITVGQVIAVIDDSLEPHYGLTETSPLEKKIIREEHPIIEKVSRPVPAAPATRRLARELGVDIQRVIPTGPGGRVTPEDVKKAVVGPQDLTNATVKTGSPSEIIKDQTYTEVSAHAASVIPFLDIEPLPDFSEWGPVKTEQLRSIRRRVAHKMVTSMILIPHVAHMDEADVTLLEEFRKKEQVSRKDQSKDHKNAHLTLLPFVIKAVTAGLKAAPSFNASLDPFKEEIIYKRYYNIGIAVDTGQGLIVPVIKNTDRKSIIEISQEIEELSTLAREKRIDVERLRGGTFTITNVGPIGGTALIPTINYPEVAILGMGRAQEKPVVREGQIVIRTILPLTLSFDHRIADGADAARFVTELVRHLSDPNRLLLET